MTLIYYADVRQLELRYRRNKRRNKKVNKMTIIDSVFKLKTKNKPEELLKVKLYEKNTKEINGHLEGIYIESTDKCNIGIYSSFSKKELIELHNFQGAGYYTMRTLPSLIDSEANKFSNVVPTKIALNESLLIQVISIPGNEINITVRYSK